MEKTEEAKAAEVVATEEKKGEEPVAAVDQSIQGSQLGSTDDKATEKSLIKGMRELGFKNTVTNLQSKKKTWDDLNVPKELQEELSDMKMDRPSIIQAGSIDKIMEQADENFLFQAVNGSGKTLSFGIPSIMKIDTSIDAVQVVILAHTRELIRQVQQVLSRVSQRTKVTICIGDVDFPSKGAHIVVTVPGWIEQRIAKRNPLDLKQLKMIVYDEADEIFLQ